MGNINFLLNKQVLWTSSKYIKRWHSNRTTRSCTTRHFISRPLVRQAGGSPPSADRDERRGGRGAEHVAEADEGEDDQRRQGQEGSEHDQERQPEVVAVVPQDTERLHRHRVERSGGGLVHSWMQCCVGLYLVRSLVRREDNTREHDTRDWVSCALRLMFCLFTSQEHVFKSNACDCSWRE